MERSARAEAAGGDRVLVAVPVAQIPEPLTYGVPAAQRGRARPGVRVRVRVGGRRLVGLIVDEQGGGEGPEKVRLLEGVLDDEPVVTERQLELTRFVAGYYLAPLGECVRLILPPDTGRDVKLRFRLTEVGARARVFGAALGLSASDQAVLAALDDETAKSPRAAGASRARLEKLRDLGLVEGIEDKATSRTRVDERVVPLEGGEEVPARAHALGALDAWLRVQVPPPRVSEAQVVFPGVRGKLRRLVELGRVRLDEEVKAARLAPGLARKAPPKDLTADQRAAIARLLEAGEAGSGAFLLEGVTGSGKTEVYLEALRATLARGQGALLVVPEIGLTPQLLARVEGALAEAGAEAEEVCVLHSRLSVAERRDALARLRRGEARVALGARSALFAPVPRLGLIVVDEEHEPSLKQEETPRYHGRDVALWRARNEGAVVVLGSATPSLESRHNAATGKLERLSLPTRVGGQGNLPAVEVIDLRERAQMSEAREADRSMSEGPGVVLSGPLVEAMQRTLEEGEQALLFLNRRGWSSFLLCDACGHVLECPSCSVSLTLHRGRGQLLCHQCDHHQSPPRACPECGGERVVPLGLGTERVEAEVQAAFPAARTARLDRDTVSSKGQLVSTLARVQRREVDVVIGTQMVAKGHDFPGIALVGVVLADVALSVPDFRAAERAFALLTQVAGRAGRGERTGRVLIQTFQPEHPAIVRATTHDVTGFAERELVFREEARYPPYWRVALARVEGEDATAVDARARDVAEQLRGFARAQLAPGDWDVLGPAPAGIERLRGKTRHQVFVRCRSARDRARMLAAVYGDERLHKAISQSRCRLVLDVDPISVV